MTPEQLTAARDQQVSRYPWLVNFVEWFPTPAGLLTLFAVVGGAIVCMVGSVLIGLAIIVGAVLGYVGLRVWLQVLRVFLDLEIHARRFVDGD